MGPKQPPRSPCVSGQQFRVPLLIFCAGLAVTALVAHNQAAQARAAAEAGYRAQHLALVNRLLLNTSGYTGNEEMADNWLPLLFGDLLPDGLGLRIDSLGAHTKLPLVELQIPATGDPERALRTEVRPGSYHWLLTTMPSPALLEGTARRVAARIWLAGILLSLLAAASGYRLRRYINRLRRHIASLQAQRTIIRRRLHHLKLEKSVLHRALHDAETRSRDLIELNDGLISELDGNGVIGFTSAYSADWLGLAPADLAGISFESHVRAQDREQFRRTLHEAALGTRPQRVDLRLVSSRDTDLPAAIRIKPVRTGTVLTGFRIAATPAGPETD